MENDYYSKNRYRYKAWSLLLIVSVSLLSLTFVYLNASGRIRLDYDPFKRVPASTEQQALPEIKQDSVIHLSQELINAYAKVNSCYLPLVNDSSLYSPGGKIGYTWEELFNELLPKENPYRNRYIVGDFMVLDEQNEPRTLNEINPNLALLIDFQKYDSTFFSFLDKAENGVEEHRAFLKHVAARYPEDSLTIQNFYNKVWKYKTPPLHRNFTRIGNRAYAAGQKLSFCEAYKDTLIQIAQFGTSAKSFVPIFKTDSAGRTYTAGLTESLPVGNNRNYYGSLYRITSKNWETERRYEALDSEHDNKLGGGNNRVTFYRSRDQLPNFLLMQPSNEFPRAMPQNGIHEVALRELSRGMLGTANSVGCIRLSDFGSKFARWWVPQNTRFFVLYDEKRYHKVLPLDLITEDLPFKNAAEGNEFRKWLIETMPLKAKQLDIDPTGQHDNGFILDAYYLYGEQYRQQRMSKKTV